MILAQGGFPNLWLVLATVIGGSLSAGSAAAFNMYLDRDIDARVQRTARTGHSSLARSRRAAASCSRGRSRRSSTVWLS